MTAGSELLCVATAGSVDDGKSTLIGRLLVDTQQVLSDQLESVRAANGELNLAHLTDGLRCEREQGITIDVAYRYFATSRRRFILADSPGHEEYTRNMVTAASRADALVVLLDARQGIVTQTRRHLAIAGMLRVPHVIAAINKIDAIGYDEARFTELADELRALAQRADVADPHAVPVSALEGDNVVGRSERTPFYDGPSLLELLEELPTDPESAGTVRLPVQSVIADGDRRLVTGQLARGALRPGDELVVAPAGIRARVRSVEVFGGPLEEAVAPRSIAVELEDGVAPVRGDVLAAAEDPPLVGDGLTATVCWLGEPPLRTRADLLVAGTGATVPAAAEVLARLDVETHERRGDVDRLELNDIGRVRLCLDRPLAVDAYAADRYTGGLILVDPATNATAGAALVDG